MISQIWRFYKNKISIFMANNSRQNLIEQQI